MDGRGLIRLRFRETLSPSSYIRGKKMATMPMIPVGPVTTLKRSMLLTERGMSGNSGDDFICDHCGHVMLEDFESDRFYRHSATVNPHVAAFVLS